MSDQTSSYFESAQGNETAINMGGQATVTVVNPTSTPSDAPSSVIVENALDVNVVADVPNQLTEAVLASSPTGLAIIGILNELKIISHLLNEGLNTKEDLDLLRSELEQDSEGG